jgi:hypothetical protein
MVRDFLKLVSLLLVFGGVVVILGTAGASDLGTIGLTEMMIRGIIGIGLSLVGYLGLKIGGFENVEIERGN